MILAEFRKSGHPYKLTKVVDGQPPSRPFSQVPSPPAGFTWNDVAYMIGGFGWKARFIGQDGFIITAGGQNQYNLATGTYSDYHKDEKKPYNCGRCHTTGYRSDGNQDDLPGLIGQWEFPGIQCEECHSSARASLASAPLASKKANFTCESCHMPFASKSAVKSGTFVGDVRSHLARINPDPAAEQFDGGLANHYLTLDFACLGCHEDKDRAWAANRVADVHGAGYGTNRVPAATRLR